MPEAASRQGYIEVFQQDLPDLEVSGQNGGFQRQMSQRRGFGLAGISGVSWLWACAWDRNSPHIVRT